jgi:hypothetical protein
MLAALLCSATSAAAQPQAPTPPASTATSAPSTPTPPPPPPARDTSALSAPQDPYGADPVLSEQIAEQLVARAQELVEAQLYVDAKQLAVEALVKSPKGNAADRARYIIKQVNQALGIKDDPPPTPPSEVKPTDAKIDLSPITDPTGFDPSRDPVPTQPLGEPGMHDGRTAGMVHGAFYGGLFGATIGAYIGQDHPASVAVPVGIATGVGAGLLARPLVRKLQWDEAQVRTAGSMNLWGGVIGGMFGDAVTGAGAGSPTAKGILLGATIGSTVGLAAGAAFATNHKLTRGDVALVDTLAGIGTVGGLTLGMLMQPAQPEAYAVNSIVGAAGGVVVGIVAAPNTNTTPRRMLRVGGLAAAGGALPFLLYAGIYDEGTTADERIVGILSTAGLVGGAYLGFRLTRNLDVGLDVKDGTPRVEDAPAAAFARNSDGSWTVGGIGLQPLGKLSPGSRGMGFTLLSGKF